MHVYFILLCTYILQWVGMGANLSNLFSNGLWGIGFHVGLACEYLKFTAMTFNITHIHHVKGHVIHMLYVLVTKQIKKQIKQRTKSCTPVGD